MFSDVYVVLLPFILAQFKLMTMEDITSEGGGFMKITKLNITRREKYLVLLYHFFLIIGAQAKDNNCVEVKKHPLSTRPKRMIKKGHI